MLRISLNYFFCDLLPLPHPKLLRCWTFYIGALILSFILFFFLLYFLGEFFNHSNFSTKYFISVLSYIFNFQELCYILWKYFVLLAFFFYFLDTTYFLWVFWRELGLTHYCFSPCFMYLFPPNYWGFLIVLFLYFGLWLSHWRLSQILSDPWLSAQIYD